MKDIITKVEEAIEFVDAVIDECDENELVTKDGRELILHGLSGVSSALKSDLEKAKNGTLTESNFSFPNGDVDIENEFGNASLDDLCTVLCNIDQMLAGHQ